MTSESNGNEKKPRHLYGWDHGADYEKSYNSLLHIIKINRGKGNTRARRALAYSTVLLTQLRNASRISEAYDAVKHWADTKEREADQIIVRKHKHDPEKRLMVLPKELSEQDRLDIKSVLFTRPIKNELASIEMFSGRRANFNTHSFRYAGITEMGRKGIAPQLIAKITKHRKLDFILGYTSQQKAEDILRTLND